MTKRKGATKEGIEIAERPSFDANNPDYRHGSGVRTYAVTESFAWRKTTFDHGRVLVERAPVAYFDVDDCWEPWNAPERLIDESLWAVISDTAYQKD